MGVTAILLYVCLFTMPDSLDIAIPETVKNLVIAVNVLFIVLAGIKVTFESRDINYDI